MYRSRHFSFGLELQDAQLALSDLICHSLASRTNITPLVGWLKWQIFMSSQFWRLEVSGQGPAGGVCWRGLPSGLWVASALCPHMTKRDVWMRKV